MRTLIVYEGSPKDILKHCTYDLENHKLMFEGDEIEKALIIGEKFDVKDWVCDYIEDYCRIHNQ